MFALKKRFVFITWKNLCLLISAASSTPDPSLFPGSFCSSYGTNKTMKSRDCNTTHCSPDGNLRTIIRRRTF